MGFERFNTAKECIREVERIAATLPKKKSKPYIILSRTPFESLWPAKDVSIRQDDESCVYDTVAWGDNVSTPWGHLPSCILAIRKDIVNIINYNDTHKPLVVTGNKPSKDWYKKPTCVYCDAGYCSHGIEDPCPNNMRMCPFIGHYSDCTCFSPTKELQPVKKPLMGPDWKPAPGFERPW